MGDGHFCDQILPSWRDLVSICETMVTGKIKGFELECNNLSLQVSRLGVSWAGEWCG